MSERILLIDGNRTGSDTLKRNLESQGYEVKLAGSAKSALRAALTEKPDLIILDTLSPRLNSLRLCHTLYNKVDAPIIALLSKRAAPLECADENLNAPLNTRRLLARVKRVLKVKQPWIMRVGDLTLDSKKKVVTRGSRTRKLRPMEARLLKTFMRRPGVVITRKELMKTVWDTDYTGDTRTLDVHIRTLRQRIEENPGKPKLLITVRGQGYRFDA